MAVGASGRGAQRCGSDLSTASVVSFYADHPALDAQLQILDVIRRGHSVGGIYSQQLVSSRQYLADLSAIGNRVLRYAEQSELEGLVPYDLLVARDVDGAEHTVHERRAGVREAAPSTVAIAAIVAVDILASPDVETAGRRLYWLLSSCRRRGLAVRASTVGWSRYASDALQGAQLSALAPSLAPGDQLRHRCAGTRPRRPTTRTFRQRVVPAGFWSNARAYFRTPGIGSEQLATALSVAVCLVGDCGTLSEVTAEFASATDERSVSRVLQGMHADERWPGMLRALDRLADDLDSGSCPIDYGRRRALPFDRFLPEDEWREICFETATPPGRHIRIRLVRCWMFERIIGTPARHCPFALRYSEFRSKLASFPRSLAPEVVRRLDASACAFLARYGDATEPLAWDPDDRLFEDCGLVRAAASRESDRNTIVEPISALPRLAAQLSRAQLINLYAEQGLSLREIADVHGVSRQTVGRLARHYGVTLRPAHRPPRRT